MHDTKMFTTFLPGLSLSVIIILSALLLSHGLRRFIDALHETKHLPEIMTQRLQVFRRWTILILTLLFVLQALGVFGDAWALISACLTAVAIGFVAAWSVLSNATAALLVLTFRPFRIGDTLELLEFNGTGIGGCVIDMNLMYTTLSTQESDPETGQPTVSRFICIPNNLLFQKVIRTSYFQERGSKTTFFPND